MESKKIVPELADVFVTEEEFADAVNRVQQKKIFDGSYVCTDAWTQEDKELCRKELGPDCFKVPLDVIGRIANRLRKKGVIINRSGKIASKQPGKCGADKTNKGHSDDSWMPVWARECEPSETAGDTVQSKLIPRIITTSQLKIDESYQRGDFLNRGRIRDISKSFDPIKCAALIVGDRGTDGLWIVDGQHRYMAAVRAGVDELLCLTFASSGPQHEAEVFYDLNKTRTGVNAVSVYRALLKMGHPKTMEIQELLDESSLSIGPRVIRSFQCASAIREVYDRGVLKEVLHAIDESFGNGTKQRWRRMFSQSHFVQMLGLIYALHGSNVKQDRMNLVLARMSEVEYQRLAAEYSGATGNRATKIAPAFIERYYNRGLRSGKLNWFAF